MIHKNMYSILKLSTSFINYCKLSNYRLLCSIIKLPLVNDNKKLEFVSNLSEQNEIDWAKDLQKFEADEPQSLVDIQNDKLSYFPPTFNLSAYANKSETIQQLIKLGVDLSRIEKRKGLPQFLLKLDFNRDMKQHIMFLDSVGLPTNSLGYFITKNPLIFKEDLDNLETRIHYLQSKKFKDIEITRIVEYNPFWLMYTTQRIDRRLGFFQKTFKLNGNEVRQLTVKQPRLITYQLEHIRENNFSILEEMGFDDKETKVLLLAKPRLWMNNREDLVEKFSYIHNDMNITHADILKFPEILTSRLYRIKQRHEFLKYLKKAQYNPKKDLYVSLKSLVEGTDSEFVINIAKSSLGTYNTFLKTL